MSYWTHIVAVIDVDTFIQDKNVKEIVEAKLKDAPKITGSEGPAEVFVNVLGGHNVWINKDCDSCQYGDTLIEDEEDFKCDADKNYKCPDTEYQTRVVITVIGDLRDRFKERTKREYEDFYRFIEEDCDFMIRNRSVEIID